METVRRLLTALAVLGVVALPVGPAQAKKHHHPAAGVKGVVLNATCPGACSEPPQPEPPYAGPLTITVSRPKDGRQVASQATTDGHFKIRVKPGLYDVSSVPPSPPPTCKPMPQTVCPLSGAHGPAVIVPCLTGETQRIQVRRHRFTHVELHVTNTCLV